ncbi:sirohydrochlorin chelatase [Bacillus sp. B-jedd]|uniref:sirohydrochlorin chelatase n=1 Tax=Bacillus sp. B-jedd TaxID=1476857 RepID=UPI0005157199|nr:sirohydrochlorin chelatase [Bacillus sp. B-jedd]CEG26410.1 sirohydrochlorin cobaltochelatase [Bacillus sp. B-jedd]
MEAILYIGHGSRSEQGNEQFISFIEETMKLADAPIKEYGFLEKVQPSIFEAAEKCIHQGAGKLTVVPVLLLPGIHANVDIPTELTKVKQAFPELTIQYGNPIGSHEQVTEILLDRMEETGFADSKEEVVLLVGHGSRDQEAAAEFSRVAAGLTKRIFAKVETGYLKADPSFDDRLGHMAKDGGKRIYLVPVLLFTGGFTDQINNKASLVRRAFPACEIVVCRPVGFDDKLMAVLNERAAEAKT